jgi:catechol 2,3-dioxygenase-like lactoylglutathione lyase family enzyme
MFSPESAFSGFSVDDLARAKAFYSSTLGLAVDADGVGARIHLPGGGTVFCYPKPDHQPATFTILNFAVEDIDDAVASLTARGVVFERYQGMEGLDEKGIRRGRALNVGPDIAWFLDPARNILSVLH